MQWIRGEQSGGERDDERCNNKIIIILWQQRSERESERVNNVTEKNSDSGKHIIEFRAELV